jgi:two-component system, NarL family, response regulator YdfI
MIDVLVEASSPDLFAPIADLLRDHSQMRVIESAPHSAGGEDQPQPDVVLVVATDGEGQSPFDSLESNATGWNAVGVPVVLLADNPARFVSEALPAGVRAVLPRNATSAEIIGAIQAVAAGLYAFHPADLDSLPMLRPRDPDSDTDSRPELAEPIVERLTPREIEVLQLLSEGLGNKEIAARLNVSEHTAKFHVASIMGKLGAASRTEAVTLGIRHGLVMI